MSEHSGSPLVFDLWDVPDGRQRDALEGLRAVVGRASRLPGFLGGDIYASVDQTRILCLARFASEADRQRAYEDPEIAAGLRGVRALARPQMNIYELVEAFSAQEKATPPAPPG